MHVIGWVSRLHREAIASSGDYLLDELLAIAYAKVCRLDTAQQYIPTHKMLANWCFNCSGYGIKRAGWVGIVAIWIFGRDAIFWAINVNDERCHFAVALWCRFGVIATTVKPFRIITRIVFKCLAFKHTFTPP